MRCITTKSMLPIALLAVGLLLCPRVAQATTVIFDDNSLAPETYWNGSDGSGGFTSGDVGGVGGVNFNNDYNAGWGSWSGWSYSNRTDITSTGTSGQYTAYIAPSGGGAEGSSNYGVAYYDIYGFTPPPIADLQASFVLDGAYFTNNAYAHDSMLNGDPPGPFCFAKRFGGASGNDPDWFKLTITGKNAGGGTVGTEFYLADYRFADNSQDYIVDKWTWVDLSGLGEVSSLEFGLTSSDVGSYGMNTPAYFAMDNLTLGAAVPEPSTILLIGFGALGLLFRRRRRRA